MRARTALWDLSVDTRERFAATMSRALSRRCPYCGNSGIYGDYFALRERCPTGGVRFEREDGYFLGAYALNLIVAEIVGLGLALWLIFRTDVRHLELIWQEAIVLTLAVAFPILFFPYLRGGWMAFDLTVHPPGTAVERQLRGNLSARDRDRPS